MTVWGISCSLAKGEPVVVGVEMAGPRETPTGQEVFRHHTDPAEDWAQKLRALAADLDTALSTSSPDAIVIRSMDQSPRGRKETVARKRYQVEGAILATARRHVALVESHSGKELANLSGISKNDLEVEAATVVGDELRIPGAAAIGALIIAGQA